jgi:hypothetical protein
LARNAGHPDFAHLVAVKKQEAFWFHQGRQSTIPLSSASFKIVQNFGG